jgi:hypothetical protein
MSRDRIHRLIFLFSLLLFVTGIPFCRPLMSFGLIFLSANWLAEGNFRWKWQQLRNNRILWVCLLPYAVHLAGLLYTRNLPYAVTDLTIKLPLLLLPLFFATTKPLEKKEWLPLLQLYLFAVCTSALIGWIHLIRHPEITDKREIAMHISYIRFELNLCFGFFVALYLLHREIREEKRKIHIAGTLLAMIWIAGMTLYIGALTAITLGICCTAYLCIRSALRQPHRLIRFGVPILLAAVAVTATGCFVRSYRQYTRLASNAPMEQRTANGRPYSVPPLKQAYIEHGRNIFAYLCEEELAEAWNQRSTLPYDGMATDNNHTIRHTLIRYMNSKGLRKDSLGMAQLTDEDVKAVENGLASVSYTRSGLEARYYETIRDLDLYFHHHEVGGSLPRRFEMWRISWITFTRHPIFGTGTGDVKDALALELEKQDSPVRGVLVRSHNQYLSFAIAFGLAGLAVILLSLLYPPAASGRLRHALYIVFLLIFLISMMSDDPMERQDGVTMFAFFNSFFLFLQAPPEKESSHK